MSIEYRTGDLLAQQLPAYAHGVNCTGVMGAEIAAAFRRRWPDMYTAYRAECRAGALTLGQVHTWQASDGTLVYNLATQTRPGPHAHLDAIRQALAAALRDAEARGVDAVGVPRIGAGIGGLDWRQVRPVLEQVAGGSVRLVVVSLPEGRR